jgi:ABC-2 type transport system permease protein
MSPTGRVSKLAWVELKLFVRDPLTLVFTFAFPLILLFVMAEVFGNTTTGRDEVVWRNIGAIDFLVPAYVALVAAAVGIVSLPVHLTSYRERGIFRRFHASGISPWTLIGAELLVAIALTLVGAALVVGSMTLVYSSRSPDSPLGVAAVFLLVAVLFAALGLLLGAVLPNPRAAQALGAILFFVMMLLCGGGPPREVMSAPMRTLADLLPLTHAVNVLQDPWLGFAWQWTSFLAVLGFLTVAVTLAARLFRWG